jgi:hypothetical protein
MIIHQASILNVKNMDFRVRQTGIGIPCYSLILGHHFHKQRTLDGGDPVR